MFGIVNYGMFVIAGILLNLTPGADTMYILGRSIAQGRKAGVVSALGIGTGAVVHTFLASLGLSLVLAKSAAAFNALKYLGAAYLIFLGMKGLFSTSGELALDQPKSLNFPRIYLQGMLTNLFNPKVALFFLAFLPQFVHPDQPFGAWPFLILGLTFIGTGTVWCLLLAYASASATTWLRDHPKCNRLLNQATGLLFVGLGLNLLRVRMKG